MRIKRSNIVTCATPIPTPDFLKMAIGHIQKETGILWLSGERPDNWIPAMRKTSPEIPVEYYLGIRIPSKSRPFCSLVLVEVAYSDPRCVPEWEFSVMKFSDFADHVKFLYPPEYRPRFKPSPRSYFEGTTTLTGPATRQKFTLSESAADLLFSVRACTIARGGIFPTTGQIADYRGMTGGRFNLRERLSALIPEGFVECLEIHANIPGQNPPFVRAYRWRVTGRGLEALEQIAQFKTAKTEFLSTVYRRP